MVLTIIKENIELMEEGIRSENQAILDGQEDFTAISAKLISDLIDEEPNTGHLPAAKVRFKKQLMLNSQNASEFNLIPLFPLES